MAFIAVHVEIILGVDNDWLSIVSLLPHLLGSLSPGEQYLSGDTDSALNRFTPAHDERLIIRSCNYY